MSFYLQTSKTQSDEIRLNENDFYNEMIIKKLKKLFDSNTQIIEYLQKVYSKISGKNELSMYRLNTLSIEEHERRNISSLLFEISACSINIFLNSAIVATREEDSFLSNIYILMFNLQTYQDPLNKIKVFDKGAINLVITELEKGFDKGYIQKEYQSVINALSGDFKAKELPFYTFFKEIKSEDSVEYIYYIDEDQERDLFNYYKDLKEIDYKELFTSVKFQNFIKNSDFTNDDFAEMSEIIEQYFLEDGGIDSSEMETEIIDTVLNNEKYKRHLITEERIKNLSFDPDGITIFDILERDFDSKNLNIHNVKG